MDVTISPPLEPVVPTFPVKRFTADQYLEMIHAGILTEEDRVELIDGVITEMAPSGPDHNWGVQRLNRLFREAWSTHYLFVQGTIRVSGVDIFDPDFALVRIGDADQQKRYPHPDEIDLLVEVAKSSLKSDRTRKAAAYAKAGIIEYWIADVAGRKMIVHQQPSPDGYQDVQSHGIEAQLTPLSFPAITVRVGDILGD